MKVVDESWKTRRGEDIAVTAPDSGTVRTLRERTLQRSSVHHFQLHPLRNAALGWRTFQTHSHTCALPGAQIGGTPLNPQRIHRAKAFGFGRLWLVTLGRLEYSRQRLFDAGSGWIPLNVNSLGAASKIVKYSR